MPNDRAKELWDASYVLTRKSYLWSEPPVPFAVEAADEFAAAGAVRVLDLPCGDGRNLGPLAERLPIVVGADSSSKALRLAKRSVDATSISNVVLVEADIFGSGFPADSFDGILCCDVLSHLTRPAEAITELLRICRPGGRVVANFFALEDSTRGPNMVRLGDEEYIFDNRFYFHFYDRPEATRLLDNLSCELQSIRQVSWLEPPHEGYREYEHEHTSWVFTIRKT